ncbi:putative Transcription factor TFIID (or TATA binding protein TBP) [Trypanosoma vivax]|nr:transcription initiation factor TFIID-like protein [Trypanosoma vivax]KAH8611742.1 putative Transcription factor TFIID (or TATA binding protein TBP) [Trypanosoma vivax]
MDDEFDDFADGFGTEEEDFFGDGEDEAGVDYAPGAMEMGHTHAGGSQQGGEDDGCNGGEESQDRVQPVNVRDLLPNAGPTAEPVVVGLIAQARLGEGIDLRALSCATRNVEFIPRVRSPAATMRLHSPSAVVQVRTSGLLTIIGASSVSEARQATELAARIIRKALGLSFTTVQFRVRSIMARFDLGVPIRLDDLAHHEGAFCSYEPDRFSGCIMRLVGPSSTNRWHVCCSVYVTGKVNVMGARSQEELMDAYYTALPILVRYCKK